MSARSFSHWSDEEEEQIGPSSSRKSSSECQLSKIKKIAEKIKESINNEIIVKSGEDQMAADVELTETDWTTINVKTVVNDRVVEVRSPSPKKSSSSKSSSKSSSEAANLRKTWSSTPSVGGKKRKQTFSSPLDLPAPGQTLLSSTMNTPDIPITKKSNIPSQNSNITKNKNIFEKNDVVSKNRKSSMKFKSVSTEDSKKMIDENLERFTQDPEVTREAVPFLDDIADLEQPIFLSRQHLGVPDLPKEHSNVVECAKATIREKRFDDDSIDRSDDESDELHVCHEIFKTYPARERDSIYIGTPVPRIVKRPDVFLRMFEKSPVIPPFGQTPSPPKIKFHRADTQRADQLWVEFVSANPELFSKNRSSHPPETNGGQNRKRRFFKTGLSGRLESEKSETRKVPQKKRKKSRSKRARKVESPKMATMSGILNFDTEDRKVIEISSDSDDESVISSKSSVSQRFRFDGRGEGQSSAATVEDRRSRRKFIEASGLRSVSGNDRRLERAGFAERMRRRRLDAASSSAIVLSPSLRDGSPCDRRAKKDRQSVESTIAKRADFMASARARSRVADLLPEKLRSRDTKVEDRRRSGNDRRSERAGFAERMRRGGLDAASSYAIVQSPRLRVGSPGKSSPEIESVYDERSAIVNFKSAESKKMDLMIEETPIGDFTEDPRNRGDIGEATIDEGQIGDLGNESPIPDLDVLFSRIDRVLAEMGVEPPVEPPDNRELARHNDSSTTNRMISSPRRGVPIIKSDVALPSKPAKKNAGGWEIAHLLTSPKLVDRAISIP